MKTKYLIISISFMLLWSPCSAQEKRYSETEKNCMHIFEDFVNYVNNSIANNADITDSVHLSYILFHFLFVNRKLADNEQQLKLSDIPTDQLKLLKGELQSLYVYLQGRENLSLKKNLATAPLRLSRDSFIYNRLTAFQKENTYVFYDKRYPNQTIGYILFLPPIKNTTLAPRIWSWTLMFKFGKYMFRSFTGEEGYEYMFSPHKTQVPVIEKL